MNLTRYINYLTFEKRFSKHTITAYKGDINSFFSFLKDSYGLTSANEVRSFHLRSFLAMRLEEGLTAASINRKKSALQQFFAFLLKCEEIQSNPAAQLPSLKHRRSLPDVIPASDMEKLFDQSFLEGVDFWGLRNRVICVLLYATGLRRSELISLEVDQIESEGITIVGKGEKERFIPFSNTLQNWIERYTYQRSKLLNDTGQQCEFLFFSHSCKALNPKTVYDLVNKELALFTSVRKKSPHMLRHAFATHLLDEGAAISSVQKLLGHAGLGATQTYTHVSINRLKNAHAKAHPRNNK